VPGGIEEIIKLRRQLPKDIGQASGPVLINGLRGSRDILLASKLAEIINNAHTTHRISSHPSLGPKGRGVQAESRTVAFSTGWVRIDNSEEVKNAGAAALKAIEHFLRIWQTCSFYRHDHFGLDEEQRFRLINACETLLFLIRGGQVERGILKGVSKRTQWAAVASATFLAIAGGIAGGVSEGVSTKAISSGDKKDAEIVISSAKSVQQCLSELDRLLPRGEADGISSVEEFEVQRRLKRGR
jgi:hypothetical protein